MSKITICVPTYNASPFVSEALDSILAQDEQDFKVIMVDDASTDNTLDILKSYCDKDCRFEIHQHKENSGACGLAIKETLSACDSEYFMWFAADDKITRHYVSSLINLIETTDVDYAYSDFELINDENKSVGVWKFPIYDIFTYIERLLTTFSGALPMNGVIKVSKVRDRSLEWLLYKGESRSSDTINGLHFRANGIRMARFEQPIFQYRIHINQLTNQTNTRWLSDKNVIDFVFDNFPEIVEHLSKIKNLTTERFLVEKYREALIKKSNK